MPILKPWIRIARLLCDEEKAEGEEEGGGEGEEEGEEDEEDEEGKRGRDGEGNFALCCYE